MPEYITYGGNQLSNQEFLDKAANELEPYLARQPWSNKRKDLFRKAYSEIMSQGVTGADNSSGTWKVQYGGTPINLESLSKKEREMYGEAAYYIQQQMAGITPKSKEEENKKDKIKFDNEYFTTSLSNHIANNTFGGSEWTTQDDWNVLDQRDSKTGLRGTENRRIKLADSLDSYLKSLNQDEITFEGSPFKDFDDFSTRINNAISALRNNSNIRDSLNAIGLKEREWLYDGGDDTFTDTNGNTISYSNYAKQQAEQQAKQQTEQQVKQQAALQPVNIWKTSPHMMGKSIGELGKKYHYNDQELKTALNGFNAKDSLTVDEQSELVGAFKYYNSRGGLINISDDERKAFQKLKSYKTITPNTLKKLEGVDGYYFDTRTNQVISFNNFKTDTNFLGQENPEVQAKKNMEAYLGNIEDWSPDDMKELYALLLDIVSIADPEALSGAALGIWAANLRDQANPNRSWFEKALDYGSGGLGGIPVIGDFMLGIKSLRGAGKFLNSSTKIAGVAAMLAGVSQLPKAGESFIKLVSNPTKATRQDLENVAYSAAAFFGLKGFLRARKRQAIQTASKGAMKTEHYITVADKNGPHDVKVDAETAKQANDAYSGFKGSTKANEAVLNNPKVKEAIEIHNKNNPKDYVDLVGARVQGPSTFRRVARATVGRNTKVARSEQVPDPNRKYEMPTTGSWYNPFGSYMWDWQKRNWQQVPEQGGGFWQGVKDFWNGTPEVRVPENTPPTNTPPTPPSGGSKKWTMSAGQKEYKEIMSNAKKGKRSGTPLTNEKSFKVGDATFEFPEFVRPDGGRELVIKLESGENRILFKSQEELTKQVAEFLSKHKTSIAPSSTTKGKADIAKMGEVLRTLKAKGVFKYGGKLDRKKIQKYKNNIKHG